MGIGNPATRASYVSLRAQEPSARCFRQIRAVAVCQGDETGPNQKQGDLSAPGPRLIAPRFIERSRIPGGPNLQKDPIASCAVHSPGIMGQIGRGGQIQACEFSVVG